MARKMIDIRCDKCAEIREDQYVDVKQMEPHVCGGYWERVILNGRAAAVIGDDIPGGLLIRNGLCNKDGSPKRYDTKSSIRKAERVQGMTNYVVHTPDKGTDKSKHTQRWV